MEYTTHYFIPTVTISLEEYKRLASNDVLCLEKHETIKLIEAYMERLTGDLNDVMATEVRDQVISILNRED